MKKLYKGISDNETFQVDTFKYSPKGKEQEHVLPYDSLLRNQEIRSNGCAFLYHYFEDDRQLFPQLLRQDPLQEL